MLNVPRKDIGPQPAPAQPRSRLVLVWIIAIVIAVAHAWLGLTAKIDECTTADEIAYIAAGHAYWSYNDFRLQPENGVLPQRLAAIPTLFTPWHMPPPTDPAWRNSDVWRIGYSAFYELGNNTDFVLFLARAASSLHVIALLLLVFGWSSRLFGYAGGFTSLAFAAFCPNLLAHGTLATSDVAAAVWLLASTGAYWRFLNHPSATTTVVSGVCLGFAAVAKYSAVLLAPTWLILFLIHAIVGADRLSAVDVPCATKRRMGRKLIQTALQVAIAWAVIWTFYGWHARAFSPAIPGSEYYWSWSTIAQFLGPRARPFMWLKASHLLPDAYAYGLSSVVALSQTRGAFLNGSVGTQGWPIFFPYAFLVKTTLPLLMALGVTGWLAVARLRRSILPEAKAWKSLHGIAPLLVIFVVYWCASIASHLNIGHRHLLPIYGPLFIAAGLVGRVWWANRLAGRVALMALLAWSASIAVRSWPDYIAYFNPLVGGPTKGFRHLVDSSLDWGQDLPRVATWLRANTRRGDTAELSYFGLGNPFYEGISARPLPSLPISAEPYPNTLRPGVYVVSATMLQQVFNRRGHAWTIDDEHRYQKLRTMEAIARAWEGPASASIRKQYASAADLRRIWEGYEQLRFARLCEYLRARHPDAEIGYSILVYRVSPEQLHRAIDGKLSDLVTLIDETTASNPG